MNGMADEDLSPLEKWRLENPDHEREVLNHFQKWKLNNTRATAVKAFCWRCMGGDEGPSPGVRGDIKNCTAPECPLFEWRPYK